jgi:hypothetical protein
MKFASTIEPSRGTAPADLSRAACFGIDPHDSNFLFGKDQTAARRDTRAMAVATVLRAERACRRLAVCTHHPSETSASSRAGSRHGFCSCNLTRDACTSERQRQDNTVDPSNAIASSKTPKRPPRDHSQCCSRVEHLTVGDETGHRRETDRRGCHADAAEPTDRPNAGPVPLANSRSFWQHPNKSCA